MILTRQNIIIYIHMYILVIYVHYFIVENVDEVCLRRIADDKMNGCICGLFFGRPGDLTRLMCSQVHSLLIAFYACIITGIVCMGISVATGEYR